MSLSTRAHIKCAPPTYYVSDSDYLYFLPFHSALEHCPFSVHPSGQAYLRIFAQALPSDARIAHSLASFSSLLRCLFLSEFFSTLYLQFSNALHGTPILFWFYLQLSLHGTLYTLPTCLAFYLFLTLLPVECPIPQGMGFTFVLLVATSLVSDHDGCSLNSY